MLSDTLRNLRTGLGFTQLQVAEALNIDRSTYTYYETGKTVPDIKTIMKLMKIFNVSYEELLGEKSNKNSFANRTVREADFTFGKINELSKQEKLMIISYRLLTPELRKDYLTKLLDEVRSLPDEDI